MLYSQCHVIIWIGFSCLFYSLQKSFQTIIGFTMHVRLLQSLALTIIRMCFFLHDWHMFLLLHLIVCICSFYVYIQNRWQSLWMLFPFSGHTYSAEVFKKEEKKNQWFEIANNNMICQMNVNWYVSERGQWKKKKYFPYELNV